MPPGCNIPFPCQPREKQPRLRESSWSCACGCAKPGTVALCFTRGTIQEELQARLRPQGSDGREQASGCKARGPIACLRFPGLRTQSRLCSSPRTALRKVVTHEAEQVAPTRGAALPAKPESCSPPARAFRLVRMIHTVYGAHALPGTCGLGTTWGQTGHSLHGLHLLGGQVVRRPIRDGGPTTRGPHGGWR